MVSVVNRVCSLALNSWFLFVKLFAYPLYIDLIFDSVTNCWLFLVRPGCLQVFEDGRFLSTAQRGGGSIHEQQSALTVWGACVVWLCESWTDMQQHSGARSHWNCNGGVAVNIQTGCVPRPHPLAVCSCQGLRFWSLQTWCSQCFLGQKLGMPLWFELHLFLQF